MKNKVQKSNDSKQGRLFMSTSSLLLATLTEGFLYCTMLVLVNKGKGKVLPRMGHEGPEGE
jgi:hypothetical protein